MIYTAEGNNFDNNPYILVYSLQPASNVLAVSMEWSNGSLNNPHKAQSNGFDSSHFLFHSFILG